MPVAKCCLARVGASLTIARSACNAQQGSMGKRRRSDAHVRCPTACNCHDAIRLAPCGPRRWHERTYGNANRSSARAFAGGREGPRQRDRRGAILLRGRKRRAGSRAKSHRAFLPWRVVAEESGAAHFGFGGAMLLDPLGPMVRPPAAPSISIFVIFRFGATMELGRSERTIWPRGRRRRHP